MKRVLWLASWYPNAANPFSGDFIKRQAEALSLLQPLKVVFAGKHSGNDQRPTNSSDKVFTNLQEDILYYWPSSGHHFLSRIRSVFAYFNKHREYIRDLKKNNELPDIVHVHVAFRAGLIALYLKWKYKIPYVLTEHWSGYYRNTQNSLFGKSMLEKFLVRKIIRHAAVLITVSEALGNQIQKNWIPVPFLKIPNVVDTRFFYPEIKPKITFRFIHISTLRYPKNPEAILRAFASLIKEGVQAELVLVGPPNPSLEKQAAEYRLTPGIIRFTGEITNVQVGQELRNSSASILFSFYENMPCVILESLCSGVPVIATSVGGIHEVIGVENGILVRAGDEVELLAAMKTMMDKADVYDREKISRLASDLFSYKTVAREIQEVYKTVLKQK